MIIPSKIYDTLKWICLTAIPALIVFLNVVLPSCGVSAENTKMIMAIIGALGTFIGTLIGISSTNYATLQKTEINDSIDSTKELEEQSASSLIIEQKTSAYFHEKSYELTGKSTQILASYSYSDGAYDYVEYLYGDGAIDIKKTKTLTDAEKEAKYEKMVCKYPEKYPISWAYDFSLTLNENLKIAQGKTTKEEILKEKEQ